MTTEPERLRRGAKPGLSQIGWIAWNVAMLGVGIIIGSVW